MAKKKAKAVRVVLSGDPDGVVAVGDELAALMELAGARVRAGQPGPYLSEGSSERGRTLRACTVIIQVQEELSLGR